MSTTKVIILAVSCLLVGLAIGFNLGEGPAKQTAISWKYGDAELVIDLEKDMADDETLLAKIFSKPFSTAGAVDWLKKTHSLFQFNDPELAKKLEELTFEDPASRELRALRNRREGPWAHQTQEVRIGIPDRVDQPFSGYANVCRSGIFFNKTIGVFLPDTPDKMLVLKANKPYTCPKGYKFPDVQLCTDDAVKLYGHDAFDQYQTAAAVVLME